MWAHAWRSGLALTRLRKLCALIAAAWLAAIIFLLYPGATLLAAVPVVQSVAADWRPVSSPPRAQHLYTYPPARRFHVVTSNMPALPLQRAITLAPHITELIYAAGAGQSIVATVNSSDYPPEASRLPRIGDGLHVSLEKALLLAPDVVIGWQDGGAAQVLMPYLQNAEIPLLFSQPQSLDEIAGELQRFGRLFGTSATADRMAAQLRARLDDLRQHYSQRSPVRVFIQIGDPPLYTVGNDALLHDALQICGAVNIYADAHLPALQVGREHVVMQQPELIIAPVTDAKRLEEIRHDWSRLNITAAQAGHVHGLHPDLLFRPGPRLIDGVTSVCRIVDEVRKSRATR